MESSHRQTRNTRVPESKIGRKGLLLREVGGELLVLDTEADQIHQLNSTASEIWRLHQAGSSASQIAEALANRFEVDKDKAEEDVIQALQDLRALGVIG
jgi:PqqD family protein of HPr-rel-A system